MTPDPQARTSTKRCPASVSRHSPAKPPASWRSSLTTDPPLTSGKPQRTSRVRFLLLHAQWTRWGSSAQRASRVLGHPRLPEGSAEPCAVLCASGAMVTLECVEKLIWKGVVDPLNEDKLTDCNDSMLPTAGGTRKGRPECAGDQISELEHKRKKKVWNQIA